MKTKTSKIFLIFLLLLFSKPTQAATRLLYYDFEDGTSQGWGTGAVPSTERAHSGDYSLFCDYSEDLDKILQTWNDETLNLPEFAVRYKWYTDNWPIISACDNNHPPAEYGDCGVKFAKLMQNIGELRLELWHTEDSNWSLGGSLTGGRVGAVKSLYPNFQWINQNDGNWTDIVIYVKYNTLGQADGHLKIYFDNVLAYDFENINYRTSTDDFFRSIVVASNVGTPQPDLRVYVDDIEIWDGLPSDENDIVPPASPIGLLVM